MYKANEFMILFYFRYPFNSKSGNFILFLNKNLGLKTLKFYILISKLKNWYVSYGCLQVKVYTFKSVYLKKRKIQI